MSRSNFITFIVKASSNYEENQFNEERRDGRLLKLYQSIVQLEELIESAIESDDGHETLFMEIVTEKNLVHTLE
jgi:hypothetical protein